MMIKGNRKSVLWVGMLASMTMAIWQFSSCKESNATQNNEISSDKPNVIITGSMKNASGEVSLNYMYDIVIQKDSSMAADSLSEDGRFSLAVSLDQPSWLWLKSEGKYIKMYVTPGDSLNVSVDMTNKDETLEFEGKGAKVNNYLAKKRNNAIDVRTEIELLHGRDDKAFLEGLDSLRAAKKDFLYAFGIENNEFMALEEQNMEYDYANSVMNYQGYHEYALQWEGKEVPDEGIPVSPEFEQNMAALYTPDPAALNNTKYVKMVESMMYYFMQNKEEEELDEWDEKVQFTSDLLKNQELVEFFIAKELVENVQYGGLEESNLENIEKFKSAYASSTYQPSIDRMLARWEHLKEGKPAPLFGYADRNGDIVELKDFKGKYVYIDVWATWCGPCMQEAPHFQELVEEFEGKDVVFLGVSVDDDEEAWMKYIMKKNPTSIQVYADGAWTSKIAKSYNIESIPRFILIDKEGNLINSSAKRPTGGIREQLYELLGETMS